MGWDLKEREGKEKEKKERTDRQIDKQTNDR
jgi:hypothetical protein